MGLLGHHTWKYNVPQASLADLPTLPRSCAAPALAHPLGRLGRRHAVLLCCLPCTTAAPLPCLPSAPLLCLPRDTSPSFPRIV